MYKNKEVFWEFEVEHTTGITEAIIRGSNIEEEKVKRVIVIPNEREGLLHRRLQEPILKENIEKGDWKFIFYSFLEDFYEQHKKMATFTEKSFEALYRKPKANPTTGKNQADFFDDNAEEERE